MLSMETRRSDSTNVIENSVYNIKLHDNCQLVIFDLDETLRVGKYLARDVVQIIKFLRNNNIKIALASLNIESVYFLKFYGIYDLFDNITHRTSLFEFFNKYSSKEDEYDYLKLRSLDKTYMLNKILLKMNKQSENVLFFDNNIKHCEEANKLGIRSIQVDENVGITWKDIKDGFELFKESINL